MHRQTLAVFLTACMVVASFATPIAVAQEQTGEQEPNDSPVQAMEIELGDTVTGEVNVSAADERDWYAVAVPAGQKMAFQMVRTSNDTNRINIDLYDPDGRIKETSTWDGQTAAIAHQAQESTTYYIRVDHYNFAENGSSYRLETYNISQFAHPGDPIDEVESNDDRAGAQTIESGQTVSGTINASADDRSDIYALEAEAGDIITAFIDKETNGSGYADTQVRIEDATGLVEETYVQSSEPVGSIATSARYSTTYYVEIRGADNNNLRTKYNVTIFAGSIENGTPNDPPSANAGSDRTVSEGDTVELSGEGSTDPNGDSLTYSWTQVSGPSVDLQDADTVTPTFTAPDVDGEGTLTFELNVSDGIASDTDTVNVTVEDSVAPADFQVSNLSAPATVTQNGTVDVSAEVTNTGGATATQTVEFRIDLNGDGTPEPIGVNESVELDGGESTTVEFAVPTEGVAPGTYTHGVFTEDDSATAELTVDAVPTASVTFDNQTSDGTTVTVASVTMSEGGFVTIHGPDGSVVGVSDYLSAGTHENVGISLFDVPGADFGENMTLEEDQTLIAMPHLDTDGDEVYDFVASGGSVDGPYTDDTGPVVDPAFVTVGDDEPDRVYYQVDFIQGEPMENLSADNLYAQQDRLVRWALGNTDEGITERGRAWATEEIRSCINHAGIVRTEDGMATVSFTINGNCSDVQMSLVSYTKPTAGFSPETADQQELYAATTEAFEPGQHTITVMLPEATNETDDTGDIQSTVPV